MDVISRQAAIDSAEKESRIDGAYGYMDTKSIIDMLEDLPSAQSEIVRCKDCKHYIDHNCYERNHINIGLFVHDNNYCGWAERRTDEKSD